MNLLDVEHLTGFLVGKLIEYECEGITISGGEPFQQAKAVLKLCNNIQESGYSIVIFSGYRKEELLRQSSGIVDELFKLADILLLGRYRAKNRYINRHWLDNPDKNFVFNTSRYKKIDFDKPTYVEFRMKDTEILITGFPTASDLNNLRKDFEGKGLVLDMVDSMFES